MDLVHKPIGQAGPGTLVLAAAVANKKTHLRTFVGSLATAGNLQFVDSDGTALSGPMALAAATPLTIQATAWEDSDLTLVTAEGKGISVITTKALSGFAVLTRQ